MSPPALAAECWLTLYLLAAIHMFFDCLALGMGLFASVMATWRPNEKFTYGLVELLPAFEGFADVCR